MNYNKKEYTNLCVYFRFKEIKIIYIYIVIQDGSELYQPKSITTLIKSQAIDQNWAFEVE